MTRQRLLGEMLPLVDEQALEQLSSQDFWNSPPVPQRELLQFRSLRARLARISDTGLDIEAMQTEQFAGAAMVSFQKSKVVVSRCEYDMEVNEALIAQMAPNLRPDLAWFVTNCTAADSRVRPLPLGLNDFCNYGPLHPITGNTDYIARHRQISRNLSRSQVLLCFGNETGDRLPVRKLLSGRDFIREVPQERSAAGYTRYLMGLAQSQFCICPRGNGIDTHRLWEALYLGCIPIVLESEILGCYAGLPILVVRNWEELFDMDFSHWAETVRSRRYDLRPLAISHWVHEAHLAAL